MVETKSPFALPKQPESRPESLFDPFFSGSQQVWKAKVPAAQGAIACEMVVREVLPTLAGLAAQFAVPQPGWWLLLLEGAGLHPTPNQQQVLAALVPQALRLERGCWMLSLPSGRVAVILSLVAQFTPAEAAERLIVLLRGTNEGVPVTPVRSRWHDLALEPAALGAVHAAEEGWLKSRAEQVAGQAKAQAEAQAQVRLTEADVQRRALRRQQGQRPLVLVVEDDPSTALLLVTMLNKVAMAHEATTAQLAARMYERHVPDLVLLDIGLPDVNGLMMLKNFRAADPEGKIVMLTANATGANLQAAMGNGAAGFLAKPFTRDRVMGALELLKR